MLGLADENLVVVAHVERGGAAEAPFGFQVDAVAGLLQVRVGVDSILCPAGEVGSVANDGGEVGAVGFVDLDVLVAPVGDIDVTVRSTKTALGLLTLACSWKERPIVRRYSPLAENFCTLSFPQSATKMLPSPSTWTPQGRSS